jgi:APA family basic amino acid/polyamine antiporter
MKNLLARKPLEVLLKEMDDEHRLRRVLGPVHLTSLGIGAIIGTGIFVLTGIAAHDKTGPALILSFVVSGMACVFAALCYAEFASMVPVAGSAYTYAYATMGELFAWIIGWDLILEYTVASATVAHGWSHYFLDFIGIFGITIPKVLTNAPFDYNIGTGLLESTGTIVDFPGGGYSAGFDCYIGKRHSGEREFQCLYGNVQVGYCFAGHNTWRLLC